ncbi:prepilin-type N-terminal cleavage/methylation domain-containing protein [Coraliomargarita algicola]|uniref:Prepilin-type N-terminal cleavage/methylation domain-containing protein n=1 Tax=Coraliomargarita algicola TaxID=3092156 RepID=A0ABZ0RSV8_9BACT|nr:prepilin-type N-terminal cleavage/methylation domain-containing protein [Coraliomargarita sp. J2-16]WPJ98166.1 prepilin-type N-terminal cleavage/methylation domain-containing protein [Coraliomargarita sp. J2-16]
MSAEARMVQVRAGFTLVEVMVGLFLFSVMSLGLAASMIQSLKISDHVLSRSTAHSIALGYAEQIMAHSYYELKEDLSLGTEFKLVAASLGTSGSGAEEQSFKFGVEREQIIVMDIDRESREATRVMPMRFTINGTSLSSGSAPLSALEIVIDYSYLKSGGDESDDGSWANDSVRVVKSLVDIY